MRSEFYNSTPFMKKILLFAAMLAFGSAANAQYSDNYFEVGAMLGTSNYFGDIHAAPFKLKAMQPAVGIFGRYSIGKWVSIKAGFNYGRLSGNDENNTREELKLRNLNFRSPLYEGYVQGEWNLLGYHPRALERPFSPYIFAGVGVFHFNPKGKVPSTGELVALQPLGTEGQTVGYNDRKPYKRTQICVPLGVGIKWAINSRWGLGLELGFRKTFTDYIDDVSLNYVPSTEFTDPLAAEMADPSLPGFENYNRTKRGNDSYYDWYLIGGVTVSYHFLDEGLAGSSKRGRRKAGCKGARF